MIAVCESRLGHPQEATGLFEQIVKLEPNAWQSWNNLGGNFIALNRAADAARAFQKAIDLNPKVPVLWFNQASAFLKLRKQESAFRSLDRAERLAPNDPEIHKAWLSAAGLLATKAATQVNDGKYQEAQALLLETEWPLKGSPYWNNLLGYADFKLNQPKPALEYLQTALHLDPDNVDFLMDMGEFLAHYRAYHEAEEIFQVASERLPDSPQVKFGLAVSLILEDRRDQATQILENLITSNPKFRLSYHALGECYEDAGNGKAMVEIGKKLREVSESNPMGWYLIGAGLLQQSTQDRRLFHSAILALERAASLDPKSSRDHFMLGKAYAEDRDFPKAIAEFKETIRLDPGHNRAHYALARVYQQMGEKKLAQAQFAAHNKIMTRASKADYRLLFALAKRQ